MIGLDTSVLARYYIDDAAVASAQRQRVVARRLIESGPPLMVSKSVVLEFEWVMRGYYGFAPREVASVLRHLMGLPQVTIEDRGAVEQALSNCERVSTSQTRCTTPATRAARASRPSTTASSRGAPEGSG